MLIKISIYLLPLLMNSLDELDNMCFKGRIIFQIQKLNKLMTEIMQCGSHLCKLWHTVLGQSCFSAKKKKKLFDSHLVFGILQRFPRQRAIASHLPPSRCYGVTAILRRPLLSNHVAQCSKINTWRIVRIYRFCGSLVCKVSV